MSRSHQSLDVQIGALQDLSRAQLVEQWIKLFKCPPPKGVKRGLLKRAIAYQLQVKRYGGLKPKTKKTLVAIAKGSGGNSKVGHSSLKPGSRLVREWHGKPYQVNVTDTGYELEGEEYASLSAIAKAITGTKWSGPRFFGL